MAPWDEWWNRNFPPYSWRRLGFLLACSPVIATGVVFVQSSARDEPFSWAYAAMLWLGTSGILSLSWIHIRGHVGLEEIEKAKKWRPPGMPPPPPLPPESSPAPPQYPPAGGGDPLPDLRLPGDSEIQREARTRLMMMPGRKPPRLDALYSFVILLVGFTAIMAAGMGELTATGFGMCAAFSAFLALIFVLRYSILSVILLSAVVAVAPAIMMHLFFFWLGGGPFWHYYAISYVGTFVSVLPFWFHFRRARRIPMLASMPMWMLSAGASLMLVLTAGIMAVSGPTSNDQRPVSSYSAPPLDPTNDSVGTGGANKEDASLRLFFAWKNDDRTVAKSVARPEAVNDLFARSHETGARFLGCGLDTSGFSKCAIWTPADLILLGPETYGNGKSYVVSVQRASHGSFTTAITPSPSN